MPLGRSGPGGYDSPTGVRVGIEENAGDGPSSVGSGRAPAGMRSERTGVAGKVADTFNEVVELNQRLASELERLRLAVGQHGKIEAHAEHGRGKGRAQLPNQAPQEPIGPAAGRRVAGPQHGGDGILLRLGAEGHRGDDRQMAPGVVVAIEEGKLLLAVGRVVGRIEVERNGLGLGTHAVACRPGRGAGRTEKGECRCLTDDRNRRTSWLGSWRSSL